VLATKIRFAAETPGHPAFGLRFATKLPTASNESGLGLDTTDFHTQLLIGKTVQSIRFVGNVGFGILAIKPTAETARALEAEAREAILKAADDAIFERRNASVAGERRIRENELNTEIAVEQKKRQIRETQLEAEASLRAKKHELERADMAASIGLEEERKAFVERKASNIRTLAEAEAHRVEAVVDALKSADPRIVQALAASGMEPGQLIAQAFGGIAERAEKIGELNVSPELLSGLLASRRREPERAGR